MCKLKSKSLITLLSFNVQELMELNELVKVLQSEVKVQSCYTKFMSRPSSAVSILLLQKKTCLCEPYNI